MAITDQPVNEIDETISLLDRAKAVSKPRNRRADVRPEMTELAIAFVRGDVTCSQAATALGCERQSAVQRLWTAFRAAVRAGRVTMVDNWATPQAGETATAYPPGIPGSAYWQGNGGWQGGNR